MSAFDQLHPALQHHIVNSLGWRELRPFQERVIPPILAGEHLVILAPTAGGKTEAAFFPVLSRMLSENWTGLSVLYVCPIKALLNNLDVRLQRYCSLLGRRSTLWHGDIKTSARRKILLDPPDCLLTTPESIEVMLVSRQVDRQSFFKNLRAVIVDEIHAFADDDRGWHLLAVLERVSRLAGRELQRVGLSATVGNPEGLCEWLAGTCVGVQRVVALSSSLSTEAEVTVDFVGSLSNAATVISRLHRGEKRLVFVDSRARAEELASTLKRLEVNAFVTHSSLSSEERHQAEDAFTSREDCVIVATSVLELGIDVGDLDRVIQIDATPTVAGFLQRMGRSGRRSGARRNCVFLATSDRALLQAAALVDLWGGGFVEPVAPPPLPLHVLAQQVMALALQEAGIARDAWRRWIGKMTGFAALGDEDVRGVLDHMLQTKILWEEDAILWFGTKGEKEFGRRNFMDLLSMITSEPLFAVRYGRTELGFVHEISFATRCEAPTILLLAGRSWQVNHLDWKERVAYVEPSSEPGRSRWIGSGEPLSSEVCQAMQRILASDTVSRCWSRRAKQQINELRGSLPEIQEDCTTVVSGEGFTVWWTFAGGRANACIVAALQCVLGGGVAHDDLSVVIPRGVSWADLQSFLASLRRQPPSALPVPVSEEALAGLKFSICLPRDLAFRVLEARLHDPVALECVLNREVRYLGEAPR